MELVIIIISIAAFVGFAVGRLGDRHFGYVEKIGIIPVPHHWIIGAIMIIIGAFYLPTWFGLACCAFGTGHFISDLNDFLHFRFFGPELPHKWKFWSIL